jgi:hypothetical protein
MKSFDIEYARFSTTPIFERTTNDTSILHINKDAILAAYDNIKQHFEQDATDVREYYERERKAFQTKTCAYCSGPIRYIAAFDFWGCANYKSEGQHSRFTGKEPVINLQPVRIRTTWLNDIINACGLAGQVRVKDLYEFLIANGCEDLRLKYGYKPSTENFSGYIKAKQRSKIQEAQAHEKLKEYFEKIVCQQCITYKLKGQPETFCIPDFICGDDFKVVVVDAKLDYVDDEKMELYIALVRHILKQKKDSRNVLGSHIMYAENYDSLIHKGKFAILRLDA